jgi:DNA-binding NtrC family response regulator
MSILPPSGRRLLLIEDDQMVRETMILMLEDDYDVLHAASVSSALDLLEGRLAVGIEVMILDCLLPSGNVGDVLAAADRRSIPVVLVSGDPNQAQAVDPTRAFLSKPFSHEMLLAVLDSARR